MRKTQDERLEDIATGQRARIVYSEMAERASLHEGKIIDRLVVEYRSKKSTYESLLGAIASISELRLILSDLTGEIQTGIQASQTETAQAERYS